LSEQSALAGRINVYLPELDRVVERVIMLSTKAINSGDDGYWDGVALNMHNYYSGVERIFEDIARTIDASIPSGSDWHQSLLVQMEGESNGLRPAVISGELRNLLDEFRGFRHVVRNVYAFNFRPARLKDLVDNLTGCHAMLKLELLDFNKFLNSLS
jgi:hypothetical protein